MTEAYAYLDYNASAPLRPEARDAMVSALDITGNASSVHGAGRAARAVVETARDKVAAFVGANPSEVIFTSGATEANNWIVSGGNWDRMILAPIEHESVYVPAQSSAAHVDEINVDGDGVADVSQIADVVLRATADPTERRTAITLQLANNETGVLQPVAETAAFARAHGVFMHTDAVQGAGRVPLNFAELDVDAMSLSAHKLGGPKGVGALVLKDHVALATFIQGGGQERRRRAGTENVAAIAGFGAAVEAALRDLDRGEDARLADLRDALEVGLKDIDPTLEILGAAAPRLANTTCFVAPGKRAETTLIKLDLAGIAVSSGSACSSGKVGASRALSAMHVAPDLAQSAIRISIGHATTQNDITRVLKAWKTLHHSDKVAA